MTVCKYFQQGHCRFGDKCRFEHPRGEYNNQPRNNPPPPRNNNHQSQNGFGSLADRITDGPNRNQRNQPGRGPSRPSGRKMHKYPVTDEMIHDDLTIERPKWLMSCYAPALNGPAQLFGGFPLEQSPEEVRVQYYLEATNGNLQQAAQNEQELAAGSNQQVEAVLNDLDGAIKYLDSGSSKHPNRHDICNENSKHGRPENQPRDGPFSRSKNAYKNRQQQQQQQPEPSFGNTGFGSSAFAAKSFGGNNAGFGQRPQNTGFGSTGFGSTPSFGSSNPAATFGGNNSAPMNAFGGQPQPSQQEMQDAVMATSPTPAFAQPQQQFGGIGDGLYGSTVPSNAGFGGPPSGAFGNAMNMPTPNTTFNQPSGFGMQPPDPKNGFSAQPSSNVSGHHQAPQNGGGMNSNMTTSNNNDLKSYSTQDSSGRLLTWKGHPVQYDNGQTYFRRNNGGLERIWFPEGISGTAKAVDLPVDAYSDGLADAYQYLKENGAFKDGIMPSLPPKTEWTTWDI